MRLRQQRIICLPITSKKALGSIPLADVKSVPVFFSERIASRTACTIATEDTKEKTKARTFEQVNNLMCKMRLTDNLGAHALRFLRSKRRSQTSRNNVDEDL